VIAALILLALVLPCALVAGIPFLRLAVHRRVSRHHRPQPQELWAQDSQLLYVERVDATGIALLAFDPTTHVVTRWTDTWAAWEARCRARVVTFTGRSVALDPWDSMVT
jgi:hypothetical protein